MNATYLIVIACVIVGVVLAALLLWWYTSEGSSSDRSDKVPIPPDKSNQHKLTFINNSSQTIWVGTLSSPRSQDGYYPGYPNIEGGGFKIHPGDTYIGYAPKRWVGRVYPRTGCTSTSLGFQCEIGDCTAEKCPDGVGGKPPVTLAEFALDSSMGIDFYDVSIVDGFGSIGVTIKPDPETTQDPPAQAGINEKFHCGKAGCDTSRLDLCPDELKITDSAGKVIGCESACAKFNTDQYCCRGKYDKPETCLTKDWPKNYAAIFKKICPNAYSFAYNDGKSTYTCEAKPGKMSGYIVTFG